MAALKKKWKHAILIQESCKENSRSRLTQNTSVSGSHEDYITQVSEENEARVTKKLSKVFKKTKDYLLGALSGLDNFLLKPVDQLQSGSAP